MSGILHEFLGDAFTLDGKEGGLNVEKMHEVIKKEKPIMNILLMGATGVGKSSLINGLFGQEVAKAGVGKSLTQHLEKYVDEEKGLILWDTKGIEAKDYQNTMESLKKEMEDSFKTLDEKRAIDVAYLCVKEDYSRVEEREKELLNLTKEWNIPTIVIFTNTQEKAGDAFVKEAQKIINEEWGFGGFVRAYVRVNSVAFSFRGMKVPIEGLKELVDETKKCLIDAKKNKQNHFLLIQKANIQARKQAMIDASKTIIHVASGAAGGVGLIPIPFSDTLAIAPIQAGMIYKMNDAFGMDLEESVAASLITGLLGVTAVAQVGRTLVNGLFKFIPVVGSVAGSATAVVITEGIGFAYLEVLETYFNDETGEVELPAMDTIKSLFKESYLSWIR
ncbi:GTP-binding protein [Helicobacter pylori]|uniref:GTPase n=1 Tax=Helicobacter pylori TaxID=210 RepID=UPI000D38656F|nr:GTPase [Helicobacter pylori]PUD14565.1 GTPase [Helicobacter pylori]BBK69610.1 GTP-binding protein [Helicobacter pylori]